MQQISVFIVHELLIVCSISTKHDNISDQFSRVPVLFMYVSLQLYFVYWDMSRCLKTLTDTLEEPSCVANDVHVRNSILFSPPPPLLIFLTCSHE